MDAHTGAAYAARTEPSPTCNPAETASRTAFQSPWNGSSLGQDASSSSCSSSSSSCSSSDRHSSGDAIASRRRATACAPPGRLAFPFRSPHGQGTGIPPAPKRPRNFPLDASACSQQRQQHISEPSRNASEFLAAVDRTALNPTECLPGRRAAGSVRTLGTVRRGLAPRADGSGTLVSAGVERRVGAPMSTRRLTQLQPSAGEGSELAGVDGCSRGSTFPSMQPWQRKRIVPAARSLEELRDLPCHLRSKGTSTACWKSYGVQVNSSVQREGGSVPPVWCLCHNFFLPNSPPPLPKAQCERLDALTISCKLCGMGPLHGLCNLFSVRWPPIHKSTYFCCYFCRLLNVDPTVQILWVSQPCGLIAGPPAFAEAQPQTAEPAPEGERGRPRCCTCASLSARQAQGGSPKGTLPRCGRTAAGVPASSTDAGAAGGRQCSVCGGSKDDSPRRRSSSSNNSAGSGSCLARMRVPGERLRASEGWFAGSIGLTLDQEFLDAISTPCSHLVAPFPKAARHNDLELRIFPMDDPLVRRNRPALPLRIAVNLLPQRLTDRQSAPGPSPLRALPPPLHPRGGPRSAWRSPHRLRTMASTWQPAGRPRQAPKQQRQNAAHRQPVAASMRPVAKRRISDGAAPGAPGAVTGQGSRTVKTARVGSAERLEQRLNLAPGGGALQETRNVTAAPAGRMEDEAADMQSPQEERRGLLRLQEGSELSGASATHSVMDGGSPNTTHGDATGETNTENGASEAMDVGSHGGDDPGEKGTLSFGRCAIAREDGGVRATLEPMDDTDATGTERELTTAASERSGPAPAALPLVGCASEAVARELTGKNSPAPEGPDSAAGPFLEADASAAASPSPTTSSTVSSSAVRSSISPCPVSPAYSSPSASSPSPSYRPTWMVSYDPGNPQAFPKGPISLNSVLPSLIQRLRPGRNEIAIACSDVLPFVPDPYRSGRRGSSYIAQLLVTQLVPQGTQYPHYAQYHLDLIRKYRRLHAAAAWLRAQPLLHEMLAKLRDEARKHSDSSSRSSANSVVFVGDDPIEPPAAQCSSKTGGAASKALAFLASSLVASSRVGLSVATWIATSPLRLFQTRSPSPCSSTSSRCSLCADSDYSSDDDEADNDGSPASSPRMEESSSSSNCLPASGSPPGEADAPCSQAPLTATDCSSDVLECLQKTTQYRLNGRLSDTPAGAKADAVETEWRRASSGLPSSPRCAASGAWEEPRWHRFSGGSAADSSRKRTSGDIELDAAAPGDRKTEAPAGEWLRLSLFSTTTADRIRTPVRSSFCEHVECFDLEFFLDSNFFTVASRQSWICPICDCSAFPFELYVDLWMQSLLDGTQECNAKTVDLFFPYAAQQLTDQDNATAMHPDWQPPSGLPLSDGWPATGINDANERAPYTGDCQPNPGGKKTTRPCPFPAIAAGGDHDSNINNRLATHGRFALVPLDCMKYRVVEVLQPPNANGNTDESDASRHSAFTSDNAVDDVNMGNGPAASDTPL
eukprot:GHVT01101352.1.p1 GENE.GHVT01101352.1~~GHVT01101352.1.p1  ORF type:complete len:1491 (+),score=324.00 GHVT01101352.1:1042-5514(+)